MRGDTVTVYLDAEDEEKALRLEFFGDELDTLTLASEAVESYVLAPREDAELDDAEDAWTSRLLEHLPGPVFLDSSELFAGETDPVQLAWLWEYLRTREVVSFGPRPADTARRKERVRTARLLPGQALNLRKRCENVARGRLQRHLAAAL